MDHSENDKRFYVYVHKDPDGNIVYVGSGSSRRIHSKKDRSKDHLILFDSLTKEIVSGYLSKRESILLETKLYNKYKENGKLLNKRAPFEGHGTDFIYFSENVYYDESSPTFLRWNTKCRKHDIGDVAGHKNKNGYVSFRLGDRTYLAHRVIWCLCNNENIPKGMVVDHIDGNRSNNNINNLRVVTPSQNSSSRKNILEHSGISWDEKINSWILFCTINGNQINFSFSPHILFYNSGTRYDDAKKQSYALALKVKKMFVDSHGVITDCISEILTSIEQKRSNTPKISKDLYESVTECAPKYLYRGVSFESRGDYYRWQVTWCVGKERKSRSFSIRKLFPDLPFEEAKKRGLLN